MNSPTVIITGASRGLGEAAAKMTAKLGANVLLNARSTDALEAVADHIRTEGGEAFTVSGDIRDDDVCQDIVDEALMQFGNVNALINNAGILEPVAPIAEGTSEAWEKNLAINFLGPVKLTQIAIPHLRVSRGRVINVSSGAAVKAIQGWGAYCTAKAALNHFTRILAVEEPDVVSIAVRPGVVDTAMQAVIRQEGEEGMPEESHARFVRLHIEGELLPPEKPGKALAALALHAPKAWNGEFIEWDDDRVQALLD